MANSTQAFNINQCHVTPRGASAQLSRSGTKYPNQGVWLNNDDKYDYTVDLPSAAWELAPYQSGACASAMLTFTIAKGQVSCIYRLKPDAPLGDSHYKVTRSDGTVCRELHADPTDPDVIINS